MYKFLLISIVLVVIVATMGLASVGLATDSLRESTGNDFKVLAEEKANSLDILIQERVLETQRLASRPEIHKAVKEANTAYGNKSDEEVLIEITELYQVWIASEGEADTIKDLLDKNLSQMLTGQVEQSLDRYGEIFITDARGAIVVMSNPTTDYYQADEYWWQRAFSGEVGNVFIDDRGYDKSAEALILEISVPITENGNTIGVLKINYGIEGIMNVIASSQPQLITRLARSNGDVIVQTENAPAEDELSEEGKNAVLSENIGWSMVGIGDERYILGHSSVNETMYYRNLFVENGISVELYEPITWYILVEESEETAFSLAKILRNNMLISILFVLLVLLTLSLIVSNKFVIQPINKLTKATEELRQGKFDTRVKLKTGDEYEELANTFNRTAEALGKLDEEHKQLEKAKTEFLSITSHELRSPMTPVKAQLQMLLSGYFGKLNKKQVDAMELVLRNTERLDRIVTDFLEISRIEAARLKFKFVKTDLTKHINQVVEEMKCFMPEKKLEIITKISRLPIVECDPYRVMQVLRNLGKNAIKFCKNNCEVVVSANVVNNMIQFSVKDNGIGISQKDQAKLFEPFFQAEKTMYREYGGTGLGLAICRGIVKSQGGKIWVESTLGKGSTFYFTMPLKPVKEMKPIKLLFSPQEVISEKLLEEAEKATEKNK